MANAVHMSFVPSHQNVYSLAFKTMSIELGGPVGLIHDLILTDRKKKFVTFEVFWSY